MKRKATRRKTKHLGKKTSSNKIKAILELLELDSNSKEDKKEPTNINTGDIKKKPIINLKGSLDNNNKIEEEDILIQLNNLELNKPEYDIKNQWQINFKEAFEKYSDSSIDSKEDDKIKNLNKYNLTKENFSKINNDNNLSNYTNNNVDKDIKIKDNSIKNYNNRDISNDIVKEGKFLLYNGFKFKLNTIS